MKQETIVIIASIGAGAGAASRNLGLTTGSAILDAGIGLALAAVGYFTSYNGGSDFVEGFGVGVFLDSVL